MGGRRMSARVSIAVAGVLPLVMVTALSFMVGPPVRAQTPPAAPNPAPARLSPQVRPVTGFVSSYEILRTARAAGFAPLALPLRNGTIYVLRATDFRGVLMRVVFDARTGAIRDATRIVPADADSYGMMSPYGPPPSGPPPYAPPPYELPPLYGPPPYGAPPYDEPAGYGALPGDLAPDGSASSPQLAMPDSRPKMSRPTAPARSIVPPLPRPRPAMVASQKSQKTGKAQGADQPLAAANPNPGAVAPAPAAPPSKTPSAVPLDD